MNDDLITAQEIRAARKKAGLTHAELHSLLGMPIRTIEDWESGRKKPAEYRKRLLLFFLEHYNKV